MLDYLCAAADSHNDWPSAILGFHEPRFMELMLSEIEIPPGVNCFDRLRPACGRGPVLLELVGQ